MPSPEERLAAEQNCRQPDESPAKKKSKKSGQHAGAVPSPEATREAEQNCRQSGESPAKKKHRRSSQQAAAVPSPEEGKPAIAIDTSLYQKSVNHGIDETQTLYCV